MLFLKDENFRRNRSVRLLTAKAVGEVLGIAPVTVLRLYDSGALQGIVLRQGTRKRIIRFREETLQKFLASREQRAGR